MGILDTQRAIPKDRAVVNIQEMPRNNRIHSDSKKRRSFLALLFAAGDAYVIRTINKSEVNHEKI
jgi:hypothetical protein